LQAIPALILLNAPHWFKQVFGAQQLVSWFWLVVFEWENAESLVATVACRYIHHPMRSALLILTRLAPKRPIQPPTISGL
jgi:hypothetical protein